MPAGPTDARKDLPPGVPPPPSPEAVDAISQEQGLIADEWAPAPPHPGAKPGPDDEKG